MLVRGTQQLVGCSSCPLGLLMSRPQALNAALCWPACHNLILVEVRDGALSAEAPLRLPFLTLAAHRSAPGPTWRCWRLWAPSSTPCSSPLWGGEAGCWGGAGSHMHRVAMQRRLAGGATCIKWRCSRGEASFVPFALACSLHCSQHVPWAGIPPAWPRSLLPPPFLCYSSLFLSSQLCDAQLLSGFVRRFLMPYSWSWSEASLLGSILSATDPVAGGWAAALRCAVLRCGTHCCSGLSDAAPLQQGIVIMFPSAQFTVTALMSAVGASERLQTVIAGESLVNDGVAFVLFEVRRCSLAVGWRMQCSRRNGHWLAPVLEAADANLLKPIC